LKKFTFAKRRKNTCTQQAVWRKAGCLPAENPVGLSSVHARANICEPRPAPSRRALVARL